MSGLPRILSQNIDLDRHWKSAMLGPGEDPTHMLHRNGV